MTERNETIQGKICLVTGATRGLGLAAASGLAKMGAQVLIIGRDRQHIDTALSLLRQESGNAGVEGFQADLSSRAEVHRIAGEILARYPHLDILINNVGATLLKYQSSPDGYEMTWALNYLGHFYLTYLLLGALKSAAAANGHDARIVEVTSSVYRVSGTDFTRLQSQRRYNGILAYAQSKRAMVTYTRELAQRLQDSGVSINAVTPGPVKTDIASGNGWLATLLMRLINRISLPPEIGVRPILRLATDPQLKGINGKYFVKDKLMADDPSCGEAEVVDQLWRISESMLQLS